MLYENLKCLLTVAKREEKKKETIKKQLSVVITQDTNIALKREVHRSFHNEKENTLTPKRYFQVNIL